MGWNDLRSEIDEMFFNKSKKLGLKVDMELQFIEDAPIVGEYVYGEAFPDENRIWLEVVAPDASSNEILEIVCHELIHLKFPKLDHDSKMFQNTVKQCMKN